MEDSERKLLENIIQQLILSNIHYCNDEPRLNFGAITINIPKKEIEDWTTIHDVVESFRKIVFNIAREWRTNEKD